ncbi:MAG: hypothetical protein AAF569_07380 [Pseudomonadota bacterium]
MQSNNPDKDRKRDKKIGKILHRSAVAFGVGIGFLILVPFLPEISDEQKMNDMKDLFRLTGFSIVFYGAIMAAVIFFMRDKAIFFNGLMNWFIVPSYAIWFGMEAFTILQ